MITDTNREDLIRARAYRLWEEGGRRHGDHDRHWHEAAHALAGEMPVPGRAAAGKASAKKAPAKKAASRKAAA